ncbi:hypothetical protein TNCV_4506121 [Trichonephila clavipes]|nr:hypothetical protein TNCV_4506121 [Trichonephila clavipes]
MSFDADGRLRIRCQAHEAMDPAYQIGTVQRHGSSIMFFPTETGHVDNVEMSFPWAEASQMEFSSKITVPLISLGWLLDGRRSITLTYLS